MPRLDGRGAELVLLAGAVRGGLGDAHQQSVDSIEIGPDGDLAWSSDTLWGRVRVPAVSAQIIHPSDQAPHSSNAI